MGRLIRLLLGTVCLGLSGIFALAFYDRYWLWRDCFNELGRCYDPETQEVYLEQAGIVWGTLAALALGAAMLLLIGFRRRR